MGNEWIMRIPLMVFTKIKQDFSENLKTKYSMADKNFTTVGSNDTPAVFPFVYVQLMSANEEGGDLEGTSINAGNFSIQIDVIDNQSQTRAREVMTELLGIMKSMRFQCITIPSFITSTNDTHRMTARFSRVIGVNDALM